MATTLCCASSQENRKVVVFTLVVCCLLLTLPAAQAQCGGSCNACAQRYGCMTQAWGKCCTQFFMHNGKRSMGVVGGGGVIDGLADDVEAVEEEAEAVRRHQQHGRRLTLQDLIAALSNSRDLENEAAAAMEDEDVGQEDFTSPWLGGRRYDNRS